MLRSRLILLFLTVSILHAMAHYTVHSTTPGVRIESGSQSVEAQKGSVIKANDFIIIPEGGEVEVYNDLDKNIYRSTKPGKISVTRLMIDAKKTASDNSKNVAARLRLAKGKDSEPEGERIYVEKGMVRRSLAIYDPDAEHLQIDSKTLGKQIAGYMRSPESTGYKGVDVGITNGPIDSSGVFFRVVNTLEFPVYFNVLKIKNRNDAENRRVEISPLGQPDGSYVLLPGQAITRESISALPEDEIHLVVVTHIRYDLDEVIDETGNALSEADMDNSTENNFPLLIKKL